MADDPSRVALISVQTSTAASLTTLAISLGSIVDVGTISTSVLQIPPRGHPVYELVGKVAASWSHLEHTLDLIIWRLAGVEPDRGACITSQMVGATSRYKAIISLLNQRKTSVFDRLAREAETLMRHSYNPQEER